MRDLQLKAANLRRLILGAACIAGIAVALMGVSTLYGALIVAAAGTVVLLDLFGALDSHYQTKVRRALQPLSNAARTTRERELGLEAELHKIEILDPPWALTDEHEHVIQAIRGVINMRRGLLDGHGTAPYSEVLALREQLNLWRHLEADTRADEPMLHYASDLKTIITSFGEKQQHQTESYLADLASVITQVRKILPPRRRATAHDELIAVLTNMQTLTRARNTAAARNDERGYMQALRGLEGIQVELAKAIKGVRSWF